MLTNLANVNLIPTQVNFPSLMGKIIYCIPFKNDGRFKFLGKICPDWFEMFENQSHEMNALKIHNFDIFSFILQTSNKIAANKDL